MQSIRVIITTYNRPKLLENLLGDFKKESGKFSMVVYDDASTKDYSSVEKSLNEFDGKYIRAEQNHGKQKFWQWISRIYEDQRFSSEELFFLLQDDIRLCKNFLSRALDVWQRIDDSQKVSLNLLRDSRTSCWTNQKQIDCGHVLNIGWVDCAATLCNRRYFDELKYCVHSINKSIFRNKKSGSGVGAQISHRLKKSKLSMYGVKESLVAHVLGPSEMNAAARSHTPLSAINFIDGEIEHQKLIRESI